VTVSRRRAWSGRMLVNILVHPWRSVMFAVCAGIIVAAALVGYSAVPDSHAQVVIYRTVVLAAMAGTIAFVTIYTHLARWWHNPIGRTIVAVDAAVFMALLPIALSLFFTFSRLTSQLAAGLDLAAISSIPISMGWRIWAWLRLPRVPGQDSGSYEEDRAPAD
jgi:hypothetical protein